MPLIRPAVLLVLTFHALTAFAQSAQQVLPTELADPPQAPEFELSGLDGQMVRLSDYRGRWVLLHFWAIWCEPCRRELPALQRLRAAFAGRMEVLSIDLGDSRSEVEAMLRQLDVQLPVLLDSNAEALQAWDIQGLPLSFLITPDGHINSVLAGERDWDAPSATVWLGQRVGEGGDS